MTEPSTSLDDIKTLLLELTRKVDTLQEGVDYLLEGYKQREPLLKKSGETIKNINNIFGADGINLSAFGIKLPKPEAYTMNMFENVDDEDIPQLEEGKSNPFE